MRFGGQKSSPNINTLSSHRLFSPSTPFPAHFISTAASKAPASPGTQPSRRHSQIQFAKAFTFRASVKSSLMSHCLKPKSGHLCPGFSVAWLQNLPTGLWPPIPRRDFFIQLIYLLLLTQTSTSLQMLLFLMCVWGSYRRLLHTLYVLLGNHT